MCCILFVSMSVMIFKDTFLILKSLTHPPFNGHGCNILKDNILDFATKKNTKKYYHTINHLL